MAGLIVTKVIREHTNLEIAEGKGTRSIGGIVDEHLRNAARRDEHVQTVTIELSEEDWNLMKKGSTMIHVPQRD